MRLPALFQFYFEQQSIENSTRYKALASYSKLKFMHILIDILGPVMHMNRAAQKTDIAMDELFDTIDSSLEILNNLKTQRGTFEEKFDKQIEKRQMKNADDEIYDTEYVLKSEVGEEGNIKYHKLSIKKLRGLDKELTIDEYIDRAKKHYINAIEKDFKERLEGFKEEVRGFVITHEFDLPDEKIRECLKILKICRIEDIDKAFLQFKDFQKQVKKLNLKTIEERAIWLHKRSESFNEITKVFACACALPLANAEVERGFSLMNNIKSELRARMTNDLLQACMLLAKYDDFDFDYAKLGVDIAANWR